MTLMDLLTSWLGLRPEPPPIPDLPEDAQERDRLHRRQHDLREKLNVLELDAQRRRRIDTVTDTWGRDKP